MRSMVERDFPLRARAASPSRRVSAPRHLSQQERIFQSGTGRNSARPSRMDHALLTNIVGTLAGIFGIIGFTPQIAKIVRERDASAVSLKMYAVTTTAFVLWVTFGVLQESWPIIVSNGIMMGLAGTILVLKLLDKKRA